MKVYAGIGSRRTPPAVLRLMTAAAEALGRDGWTLRSGAAAGADSAFESGAVKVQGRMEIFLPWPGFEGRDSRYDRISQQALEMAATFHPAWKKLSSGAQKLHARNCYQVLGYDLKSPASFVMCWTPNGDRSGGTGQALRIAEKYEIRIFDLGLAGIDKRVRRWLGV